MQIRKFLPIAVTVVLALAPHASLAQKSSTTKSITVKVVGVNDYGKIELTGLSIKEVNDADALDGRMVMTQVLGVVPHGTFTNTSGKDIQSIEFTVRIKVCDYSPFDCLDPYVTIPGGYAAFPNALPNGGVGRIGGGRVVKNLSELQFIREAISGKLPIDIFFLDIVYANGVRQISFSPKANAPDGEAGHQQNRASVAPKPMYSDSSFDWDHDAPISDNEYDIGSVITECKVNRGQAKAKLATTYKKIQQERAEGKDPTNGNGGNSIWAMGFTCK